MGAFKSSHLQATAPNEKLFIAYSFSRVGAYLPVHRTFYDCFNGGYATADTSQIACCMRRYNLLTVAVVAAALVTKIWGLAPTRNNPLLMVLKFKS